MGDEHPSLEKGLGLQCGGRLVRVWPLCLGWVCAELATPEDVAAFCLSWEQDT